MNPPDSLFQSSITSLPLIHRGKVRDIYSVDEHHMLIVTTDRLSAFDVIMQDPIPGKGIILTKMASFWFDKLKSIVPNQLSDLSLEQVLTDFNELQQVTGRAIIVKKLKALPIEAIVRGYIIGSGWKDYQQTGAVCGNQLPAHLELAQKLPEPIYTPSTKAEVGAHDENVDFNATRKLVGDDIAQQVKTCSLELYRTAAAFALEKGIIIADTKFEFGLDENATLTLIDEVLTPDSSRFWPVAGYQTGISPPSYDKQFVRDYLETLDWNKTSPAPPLPVEITAKTAEKYREALQRLTT